MQQTLQALTAGVPDCRWRCIEDQLQVRGVTYRAALVADQRAVDRNAGEAVGLGPTDASMTIRAANSGRKRFVLVELGIHHEQVPVQRNRVRESSNDRYKR